MDRKSIQAIKMLQRNKIVAFPTETVFALACDASNSGAVSGVYKIKKRPKDNPLALFVDSIKQVENVAIISSGFCKLFEKFSPGPITYVLKKKPDSVLARNFNPGLDTIAVRFPDHAVAQEIIAGFDGYIAATSANISGQPPATDSNMLQATIGDKIDYIIDGKCDIGTASTIVDLSGGELKILREGSVTEGDVRSVLLA